MTIENTLQLKARSEYLLMQDTFNNWHDWLTVFGYVGFTVFIMWRVFATK